MSKSTPVRRARRLFTLEALRTRLLAISLEPEQVGAPLAVPALITLKKWSQDGFFSETATLEGACAITLKRLQERGNYYPAAKLSKPSQTGAKNNPGHDAAKSLAPGNATTNAISNEAFNQEVLTELRLLSARLGGIESKLERSAGQTTQGPTQEGGPTVATLVKALDQLDASRRHMSLRLDSEIQLVRQNATAAPGKTTHTDDGTFMELQRMNKWLNQIAEMLREKN